MMFFGRRQFSTLPTFVGLHHDTIDLDAAHRARLGTAQNQAAQKSSSSRELTSLQVGQKVRIYDDRTGKWGLLGQVSEVRDTGRSYFIELDNGKTLLRNRRFLKPISEGADQSLDKGDVEAPLPAKDDNKAGSIPPLRRSERPKKPKIRFDI